MLRKVQKLELLVLVLCLLGCAQNNEPAGSTISPFDKYWQDNGAEITSFELKQARYGEMREGTAVLVFVTEPFSKKKQVKLDHWKRAGKDRIDVPKMNMTKNFITGIYPYSMMMSTFTPVGNRPALKVTTSSQEWCGHTFMQLNKQDSAAYSLTSHSYFESEGDRIEPIYADYLEDQVWTTIRLDPDNLPRGQFKMLPASFYMRLKHRPVEAIAVTGTLIKKSNTRSTTGPHSTYSLVYADRTISIHFEESEPYCILGWEETYSDGVETLTTVATRIQTIRSEYWQRNSNEDVTLRKKLGL